MSEVAEAPKRGFFARLKAGLSRTASALTEGITSLFTKRKLDDAALEELEDVLLAADLGPVTAANVVERLRKTRFGKEVTPDEIRAALAEEVAQVLLPLAKPLVPTSGVKPFVVLVVGVNGTGKTTTIGKLAKHYREQGKQVLLAAGDTFRAAAIEQLTIWAERTGAGILAKPPGADAAGLAFDALTKARGDGTDVLLIDTAGRLQNKAGLMAELEKIVRVLKKVDASAPHACILTLDATTGQNAINQVEVFRSVAQVTGLVMTKRDGTARGGVLVAVAQKFALPVHFVGVGESADDLQPFDASAFARALAGAAS